MLFHGSIPVCAHHVQCTLRFLNYSQISSLKYTVCFVDKCCIVQLQIKLQSHCCKHHKKYPASRFLVMRATRQPTLLLSFNRTPVVQYESLRKQISNTKFFCPLEQISQRRTLEKTVSFLYFLSSFSLFSFVVLLAFQSP